MIYYRVDSMNVQNRSLAKCFPGLRQKTYVCLMHSLNRPKVAYTFLDVETSVSTPRWLPCSGPNTFVAMTVKSRSQKARSTLATGAKRCRNPIWMLRYSAIDDRTERSAREQRINFKGPRQFASTLTNVQTLAIERLKPKHTDIGCFALP